MGSASYFSLLSTLDEKVREAALSALPFYSDPLRSHLLQSFSGDLTQEGHPFLANPAFEGSFAWKTAPTTMGELEGEILSHALVESMDRVGGEYVEYRFPRDRAPYRHQVEAWKILKEEDPTSLVVTSGTGSGKTECYLVPILDRLARLADSERSPLVGVRAIFLYPLNALINSQKSRLNAWTGGFNGKIRYCLYNGNLPDRLSRTISTLPAEVPDRKRLRESPPPILLTNPTMLEYMLVRNVDAPILKASRGTLEYIIIDEAHSYIGSQAAEMALLLRRVLHAFDVSPERVRFIATSATMGPREEGFKNLIGFFSDMTGQPPEKIRHIEGSREIPRLPDTVLPESEAPTLEALTHLASREGVAHDLHAALAIHPVARRIYDRYSDGENTSRVCQLSTLKEAVFPGTKPSGLSVREEEGEVLRWLDLLSEARDARGQVFLPMRAHLIFRSLANVWACIDPQCPHRAGTPLDSQDWPFGAIHLGSRSECFCGGPLYEAVFCPHCGEVSLRAQEEIREGKSFLNPVVVVTDVPGFNLEDLDLEEAAGDEIASEISSGAPVGGVQPPSNEEKSSGSSVGGTLFRVLIFNRPAKGDFGNAEEMWIDRMTRQISSDPREGSLRIQSYVLLDNTCPDCGQGVLTPPLRSFYVPPRFFIPTLTSALLEFAPDTTEAPADKPSRGRRLLAFNDSRQGSARIAASLQQFSERSRLRSLVYHHVLQRSQRESPKVMELRNEIAALEPHSHISPDIMKILLEKRKKLDEALALTPVSVSDLIQGLSSSTSDLEWMLDFYVQKDPETFSTMFRVQNLARLFLVREFGNRSRTGKTLETMGMISLVYPKISMIDCVPSSVLGAVPMAVVEWRSFLKMTIDHFLRPYGVFIEVEPRLLRWMGIPYWPKKVVPADKEAVSKNLKAWPSLRGGKNLPSLRIIQIMAHGFGLDPLAAVDQDRMDMLLSAAWDEIFGRGILTRSSDGALLSESELAFVPLTEGYVCPLTRTVLDTVIRGKSPYLSFKAPPGTGLCERISIPLYPDPFGGTVFDEREKIDMAREWLRREPQVDVLKRRGLWSELSDRIIEMAPFARAAEHSAQQDSHTLNRYEESFRKGGINVLSCSTTMEMGIDIGGVSVVAMNNLPPHPANYLQRAGRSGRRGEGRSVSLTILQMNPHDQRAFHNSLWAFSPPPPLFRVPLDSERIVDRHINAFLLTAFLRNLTETATQEKTALLCGWFFAESPSPANLYVDWCRSGELTNALKQSLKALTKGSVKDKLKWKEVLEGSAMHLDAVSQKWLSEWTPLKELSDQFQSKDESDPVVRAIGIRLARLENEYLLRELSSLGFLPAYGFPSDIVVFDNMTSSEKRARGQRGEGENAERIDNLYRRREFASRERIIALREYAPSSRVVIDGLTYVSAGITLNWHLPPDKDHVKEIQNIKTFWFCHRCGSGGTTALGQNITCLNCGTAIKAQYCREFLIPSGFAVDFNQPPSNDLRPHPPAPLPPPHIEVGGEWVSMGPAGRLRKSSKGHLIQLSGSGQFPDYLVCLACGRVEPAPLKPDTKRDPHFPLRGTSARARKRGEDVYCEGLPGSWKVKSVSLGHETYTDALEIQLRGIHGLYLDDLTMARTLAVSFRLALAEILGVSSSEIVATANPVRDEKVKATSIILYDKNASGYSTLGADHFLEILERGQKNLDCPAQCESACVECLIEYDMMSLSWHLDRKKAKEFLSNGLMEQIRTSLS